MGFASTNNKGGLAMQNPKSGGGGGRLNPRKIWSRSKTKLQSRNSSGRNSFGSWESLGNGMWTTSGGLQVLLSDTTLFNLSEVEVNALRQLALAKLQAMDLGCNICIPKTQDNSGSEKRKRKTIGLKKRALTTGFFENSGKSKGDLETRESSQTTGMVFGIPLDKCIQNDRANRRSTSTTPLRDVANLLDSRLIIGSASAEDITNERFLTANRGICSSQSSCNIPLDMPSDKRFYGHDSEESFDSLKLGGKSYSMSGLCFIDSLQDWPNSSDGEELSPHIPHIVNTCFSHLETNGLHRLGLFRISSSKKRIKQLRDDFDSGKEIDLSKNSCPHDVATLLKEYFRDLPEPLLTRELYLSFVGSQRIRNRRQQLDCLSHLVQLLPVANRDTLWALLRFLWKVASNSMDHRTEAGEWVTGNKMDSHNLATLFGPNILHMAKPSLFQGSEFQVESSKRAEERIEVIKVVRTMIDNYKELYEVSAFLLDELYHRIHLQSPEVLARLLVAKLSPTDYDRFRMEMNPDTGSSACSETASISHLQIDSESLPDHEVFLGKHLERGSSSESVASAKRPERGGSLGRDIYNKAEMVTSRLFRRRGKSSTREEQGECGSKYDDASHQWFRKKEDKKHKRDKSKSRKQDPSESDGSCSSDHKATAVKKNSEASDHKISYSRPLTMQENVLATRIHSAPTIVNASLPVTQVMAVVDIRKEHLNVPEVTEKRHAAPETGNPAVISASLTLKVPLTRSKTGPAISFGQSIDVPYIEDEHKEFINALKSNTDRLSKMQHEDDRVTSRQSTATHASSPSSQVRSRSKYGLSERMAPLSVSASTSAIPVRRYREYDESSTRQPEPSPTQPHHPVTQRQRSRTRTTETSGGGDDSKSHPSTSSSTAVNVQWPQETWKRWEIISSEHTEQETVV